MRSTNGLVDYSGRILRLRDRQVNASRRQKVWSSGGPHWPLRCYRGNLIYWPLPVRVRVLEPVDVLSVIVRVEFSAPLMVGVKATVANAGASGGQGARAARTIIRLGGVLRSSAGLLRRRQIKS
jgi:hypothetical protein